MARQRRETGYDSEVLPMMFRQACFRAHFSTSLSVHLPFFSLRFLRWSRFLRSLSNQETSLEEKKTDLDGETKELEAAMAYWEKLKPQCVDAVESYEDRVARRRDEIASLQEALKILTE